MLDYLKDKGIEYEMIPAGATGYLQSLDISINKPFKSLMKDKFNTWFNSYGISEANKTAKGYLRPPKYDDLISWTLESLPKIESEVIRNSLKITG